MEGPINNTAVAIETKITAPIIWNLQPKFRIQDLREDQYEEVITLIKHHYFREEPMCKSIKLLQDPVSVTGYLDLIRTWMKDTTSLVAVSAKSGRVVGAVITRINSLLHRTNTYSRVQIFEGEVLDSIMRLKSALVTQANVYAKLGHDTYFRVYLLSVHPSYKKKAVGKALLEACNKFALNMKIPIVAGIFTSSENQLIADNVGFSLLTQIPYNNWLINDKVVFDDPGIENYSAAFMSTLKPNKGTPQRNKKSQENRIPEILN